MANGPASGAASGAVGLTLDLDRSSPVPLYFQIASQIEVAIDQGDLAPGDRLENEISLADRFGLSRPTVRRAIQELVARGLLVRKRGVGTQVVRGRVKRPIELTSLYDDLSRQRQQPTTNLVTRELRAAGEEIATVLGVPADADVLYLERVRLTHGEPLALMHNWLPSQHAAALTEELLAERGMYQLLRASGVHLRIATQRIGARLATAAESSLLLVAEGSPVLTAERTAFDDSGSAVELGRHAYRADGYSFEFTLVDR
jgi:DNA-binding GntR family transcriptional regulator